ncbi:MAG: aminoglycoside phosphotransferase family protein [Desulfobacterota bacterium]|nr:aminoglycoside phosphotransferase family protein [Thermodesulfobacteriota bacterium]
MNYTGHLSQEDQLYGYLRHDILPKLGINGMPLDFRVYSVPASNHVYVYEDQRSGTRLIGKFFRDLSDRALETACRRMEREFNNLKLLRNLGFTGYPHYVARPLGHNASLGCVLIEEFCHGTPLIDFILKAILEGARDPLFQKLTSLAYFLATVHNRTATGDRVDFNRDCSYFDRIVAQLKNWGHIGYDEAQEFYRLKDRWREKGIMWEDNRVLVHGDMTPTNVLFGDSLWVIAIDLERMKLADRVFDVGRVVGEIKRFFMEHTGDGRLAEPFIGHFLWEYACHFPDRNSAFASITRRIPFHMGLTLLRIARNSWINGNYRRQLLNEAKKTLV